MTLQELRRSKGLRQIDVASKLDVSLSTVSNWEMGRFGISKPHIKKVAKLYGVTAEELTKAIENTRLSRGFSSVSELMEELDD